jgi:hypothetical protein
MLQLARHGKLYFRTLSYNGQRFFIRRLLSFAGEIDAN